MKVNIDKTEEVSDTQRVQIANVLDQKVSKRQATRDELKGFLWAHGASWADDLVGQFTLLTGDAPEAEQIVDEDEGVLIDVDMGELDDIL